MFTSGDDLYGRYLQLLKEQGEVEKENEQLKQRIKQLEDVDRLIDEKIEEYLNIPSLSDGALIAFKELKKELKGGVE
mgnify:CR=1 FL=1